MVCRRIAAELLIAGLLSAQTYEALFDEAAKLSAQGQYELAAEKYRAALKLRPGAAEALNNLAAMLYAAHHYAEALDAVSKIWRTHPEMHSAALIAGLAAVQCNRPRDAIAPLESLLETGNREALIGLGSAHLALGELLEAARFYETQVRNAPADSEAWYDLAICYERMAEDASRKLARTPGGITYSKRLLGEYLLTSGDTRLAQEAFGEAEKAEGTGSAEAADQYEIARELAGKSRKAFETFIGLAPDSWQAHLFLGDVDRQHRNFSSALEHYQQASKAQPENPAPLLGMGTVYWELGQFDAAVKYLQQTLRLNPRSGQATFELANIAVRRHQDAEAIPLLKSYLAFQPDAAAARADLGRAYLHLGDYQSAVEELTKGAGADERGDVHFQLATALRKLGRAQEADAALRKSTELRDAQLERERRLKSSQ